MHCIRKYSLHKEVKVEYGLDLPDWIVVLNVKDKEKQAEIEKSLDKGEASSIALELKDSLLIIDEMKGRKIAKSLHVEIIGTIGILLLAGKKGLIKDMLGEILKLVNNGFRLSDKIVEKLIEQYGKNRT